MKQICKNIIINLNKTVFCFLTILLLSTLSYAQLKIDQPNGGEIWKSGTQETISWSNNTGIVQIEYSTNHGLNWISVGNSNSGSFLWTIPAISSPNVVLKIMDTTLNSDTTNSAFRIINPDITNLPVKILPLGNSITFDAMRAEFRYSQDRISYRGFLWDSLKSNNYYTDFIGHRLGGYYKFPDPENCGIPGITAYQLNSLLRDGDDLINGIQVTDGNYLSVYSPDIVLLHIGTNDITDPNLGTSSANVENILQWIKTSKPNTWVIVALIIDKVPTIPQVTIFNNNVRNMVNARIANGDNILLVNMHDALTYDSLDNTPPYSSGDMFDDTHPNDSGKVKMASVWFSALKLILPVPSPQVPVFTSTPKLNAYLGLPYKYDANSDGIGAPIYSLTGTVPLGMIINSNTGIIDWVPQALGDFSVSIKAENSSGSVIQNYTLTVSSPPPIINNTVSYWKFDEVNSSAVFEDLPGINDAIPISSPSIVDGIVGNSLNFNGSNKLDVLDDSSLYFYPTEGITIEAWINTSNSGQQILVGKRGGGYSYYHLGLNSFGKLHFEIRDSLGVIKWITDTSSLNLIDGEWHHVAGVIDRTTNRLRIYRDGIGMLKDETLHNSGFYNYDPLTIGYYKNANFYNGKLDELAIYNRRVLGTEIARHFITGLARKGYTNNYVSVKAKVLLQGPYNSATGIMDTTLKREGLIPKNLQPFAGPPWNYDGLERITSVPDSVVDWIFVELRDSLNPEIVVASRAALLKKDGKIIDILSYLTLGSSDVIFSDVSPGNYYIAIKHRNHLSVMSSSPVFLPNASEFIFSNSNTWGTNAMKDLGGSKFGMWAGDINQDKYITTEDYTQWYNAAIVAGSGYKITDINLDGFVTTLDYTLWFNNAIVGANSTVP